MALHSDHQELLRRFDQELEDRIRDEFLDRDEELELRNLGQRHGLTGRGAKQRILRICHQRRVTVESEARRELKHQVRAALEDGFLVDEEMELLLDMGRELFAACGRADERVDELVREMVEQEGGVTERDLVAHIRGSGRGGPGRGGDRRVDEAHWARYLDELDRWLAEERGVELPPGVRGLVFDRLAERAQVSVGGESAAGWSVGKAVLLGVLGGFLLLLLLAPWRLDTGASGTGMVALPTCDAACRERLADLSGRLGAAVEERRFVRPADNSVLRWSEELEEACARFFERNRRPVAPTPAAQASPWAPCLEPNLEGAVQTAVAFYVSRADGVSRDQACDYLGRCLRLSPEETTCRRRFEELGCD